MFENFPFFKIQNIIEIIYAFLCLEKNAQNAHKYLKENKNIIIIKHTLLKIYAELKGIIYKYMKIVYRSEMINLTDNREYFSVDESLISHKHNKQIWLIGIINNITKDFSFEGTLTRDSDILKNFIIKYVGKGNTIISDGWADYGFLNSPNSGYSHITHIHLVGSFGFGVESTSHIEAIWNIIKGSIKTIYHFIPSTHVMHFVREAEYRYKIRDKTENEKIKDSIECYQLILNTSDSGVLKSEFLIDTEDNDYDDLEEDLENSD